MTHDPHDPQAGFTLIEVLLVCVISLIVLGATLTAYSGLLRGQTDHARQADEMENTRLSMEHAARQLRNLANPTASSTSTIDTATDYEFIFQTSDPTKTWVRYCLQTSGSVGGTPVSPARGVLWEMESTATAVSAGMRAGCPGPAGSWARQHMVADHVTNRTGGVDRNVFTFSCSAGAAPSCPASAAEYPKITNVAVDLFTDIDPARRPREQRLSSAVYLRNQNEVPTASFTQRQVSSRRVLLNASASADPEGRTLQYFWFKNSAPVTSELNDCTTRPATNKVAEGVTHVHDFPVSDGTGAKPFWLVVRDPGCLYSTYGPIDVVIP
jgi:prepilin-type N-terminal cleavage/methylation domain-containing protein